MTGGADFFHFKQNRKSSQYFFLIYIRKSQNKSGFTLSNNSRSYTQNSIEVFYLARRQLLAQTWEQHIREVFWPIH